MATKPGAGSSKATKKPTLAGADGTATPVGKANSKENGNGAGQAARMPQIPEHEFRAQVAETAYHRAAARGFTPGYEEQDWLEAEREVRERLGRGVH